MKKVEPAKKQLELEPIFSLERFDVSFLVLIKL